ncbi:uncharacterized protein LOC143562723 [Bidens hawaiensis]|uniref:uncharacterized protein LOC143562723 n=1 Tax=Bidens hawaiensis TaxID=980011 RepID=UPI00404A6D43
MTVRFGCHYANENVDMAGGADGEHHPAEIDIFRDGVLDVKLPLKPNLNDLQQLYDAHESKHGFPEMLSSLDCVQWELFNCPTAWRGQYMRGDHRHPTLALEVVALQDLWIWHAYFGVAGSNNDLNVLEWLSQFIDIESGVAPDSFFEIDGIKYKYSYFLVDAIYHDYAVFIDSFKSNR